MYIYLLLHYMITLSRIFSTFQIITHSVCHKPTKWDIDNNISLFLYVYYPIYQLLRSGKIWHKVNF